MDRNTPIDQIEQKMRAKGKDQRSLGTRVHDFVKKYKLVSRGLSTFGHHDLAMKANLAGYGRRRPRRRAPPKKRVTGVLIF